MSSQSKKILGRLKGNKSQNAVWIIIIEKIHEKLKEQIQQGIGKLFETYTNRYKNKNNRKKYSFYVFYTIWMAELWKNLIL